MDFNYLETVIKSLREIGLELKPKKCALAEVYCQYLGHSVGEGKIRLLQAKVKMVLQYPPPTKKKDMHEYLGLTNFYRRFVSNYISLAIPLMKLQKWSAVRVKAFEHLKKALESDPLLASPNEAKRFILHINASGIGIGDMFSQDDGL